MKHNATARVAADHMVVARVGKKYLAYLSLGVKVSYLAILEITSMTWKQVAVSVLGVLLFAHTGDTYQLSRVQVDTVWYNTKYPNVQKLVQQRKKLLSVVQKLQNAVCQEFSRMDSGNNDHFEKHLNNPKKIFDADNKEGNEQQHFFNVWWGESVPDKNAWEELELYDTESGSTESDYRDEFDNSMIGTFFADHERRLFRIEQSLREFCSGESFEEQENFNASTFYAPLIDTSDIPDYSIENFEFIN